MTDETAEERRGGGTATALDVALAAAVDAEQFSGVVVVDDGGRRVIELASGLAARADERAMRVDTRLASASVTKGFTALTVMSMVAEGRFALDTTLRSIVGDDLARVHPDVTIEHLLGHTSGVGDYLDEDVPGDIDDHAVGVSVHELTGPEAYVPLLDEFPQADPPGERFKYNNGAYVMLALAIERSADGSYHDEVRRRVFEPAGMTATDFLRSDRLPADTALGYLGDGRTNVFHLPVIGTGDGGAYVTAPDMIRFWRALFDGAIVERSVVDEMVTPRRAGPGRDHYGLGFWVAPDGSAAFLVGMDAGVSIRTGTYPATGRSFCVVANDSSGAWPIARVVESHPAP